MYRLVQKCIVQLLLQLECSCQLKPNVRSVPWALTASAGAAWKPQSCNMHQIPSFFAWHQWLMSTCISLSYESHSFSCWYLVTLLIGWMGNKIADLKRHYCPALLYLIVQSLHQKLNCYNSVAKNVSNVFPCRSRDHIDWWFSECHTLKAIDCPHESACGSLEREGRSMACKLLLRHACLWQRPSITQSAWNPQSTVITYLRYALIEGSRV